MKRFLKRLLFGKPKVNVEPMYMSVFKDKYGNLYGGAINPIDKAKHCVDIVSHIDSPKYLGKVKIYMDNVEIPVPQKVWYEMPKWKQTKN
jgi:uncharacterized protein YhaN